MAKNIYGKSWNIQQVKKVLNRYDAEHDLGPDCPVTWREEALASAVMELSDEIDKLKAQVAALLDAVPSAKASA